jgi:hypothetical protein
MEKGGTGEQGKSGKAGGQGEKSRTQDGSGNGQLPIANYQFMTWCIMFKMVKMVIFMIWVGDDHVGSGGCEGNVDW